MHHEGTTPRARYQEDLARDDFIRDPQQALAIARLQAMFDALIAYRRPTTSLRRAYRRLTGTAAQPPRGLYLWGGVGRGKTYLMDTFYDCLPTFASRRVHFHRFMQDVHDRLAEHQQLPNPLTTVATALANEAQVLCFDEFFVSDIADAMILAGLLQTLFERGVTLIATSNSAPRDLYRDGLQRAKFLPAIDLIEKHCDVMNIDGGIDYRLRILKRAAIYHWPLDDAAHANLWRSFEELAPGDYREACTIHVNHREIPVVALADGIAWFEFAALCDAPRSSADFIELARRFNTVFLANVPSMTDGMNDPARRFIHLVDEFYDRNVNLIVAAAVSLEELYQGQRLIFEFQRTRSRLAEMQSYEYLAREHRP